MTRAILTSSAAAITDEPEDRVYTEADWNEKSSLTRNPYYYSKTLAERAAWDFVENESPSFDLTLPYVDVRDVAEAHVRAAENPNVHR